MSENNFDEDKEAPKARKLSYSDVGYFPEFSIFNVISVSVVIISIFFVLNSHKECEKIPLESDRSETEPVPKTFKAFGKNLESGYLHNVYTVLERFGFEHDPNSTDWDLLWAHDYPFRVLYKELRHLKSYQKVNHFPGCGYITNKVDLATSGLKYIPPAFKLPGDKKKLLKYIEEKPDSTFVEKNNDHRNILFRSKEELIALESNSTFVQEFVAKPLLINGHKFDIGIYTVITSIDPLRIYIYNGDAILRFCPVKYYPFDAKNLDKYVVGDDYLPVWKVPSLEYYYNELGFGMKESLNSYLQSIGKDPSKIWDQIEESLRITILAKEQQILSVINKFKFKRNFFELMRFDFLVDEDLNVFLLEANMSPNLSSAHFPPNQLLYQQVLYNVLSLVGVGQRLNERIKFKSEQDMIASYKNIAVYPAECNSMLCRESCMSPICQLCKPCLSYDTKEYLVEAYREHMDKGDCKRVFPPSMSKVKVSEEDLEGLSPENQLMYTWFKGKCLLDESWC
ncbi:probable tubulin polyglutamylase ttll-15 [Coccinella septempunctata]|uniref:probable tubulin polyglutamylase ttll-15 n=1 Tax=Coccinella septempunctata TaxID=41139 RepID=UPI001D05F48D|nr:probable tubulin polyglutamylase ttll-15 [Coccinella septempunctata]